MARRLPAVGVASTVDSGDARYNRICMCMVVGEGRTRKSLWRESLPGLSCLRAAAQRLHLDPHTGATSGWRGLGAMCGSNLCHLQTVKTAPEPGIQIEGVDFTSHRPGLIGQGSTAEDMCSSVR